MNNNWDRLLIGIMSLGYLVASCFLIVMAFNWADPLLYVERYLDNTEGWVLGFVGVLAFISALALFVSSVCTKEVKKAALHETNLGQIKITVPALEHLVTKSAKTVLGVRDVKPLLKTDPGGLSIQLKAHVTPDVSIPNVTADLQKTVKDYMLKTAGITVNEIIVLVNKVSWDTKSRVE